MKGKVWSGIIICIMFVMGSMSKTVYASTGAENDIYQMEYMRPYINVLKEINQDYGTTFMIPTKGIINKANLDCNDIVNDILSMTVSEFDASVRAAYLASEEGTGLGVAAVQASTITQKAYFNSGNYLSISATTYTANSEERYSSINSYSYGYSSTPFYKPISMTHSLKDSSTKCYCTFTCYKMLTASVMYSSTEYDFSATFSASGGSTDID